MTFFGTGTNNFQDFFPGAPPYMTEISRPGALALDSAGILAVMEQDWNLLLAANTSTGPQTLAGVSVGAGLVEHIAGDLSRRRGFNGDGVPARFALFEEPQYLAIRRDDASGIQDVYVSDRRQLRIRLVTAVGTEPFLYTWVGTGQAGFNGEGIPPENVLAAEPLGIAVVKPASGTDTKTYLYFADGRNRRVRRQVLD